MDAAASSMDEAGRKAAPIVRLTRDVLGQHVVGAYLHGSAVLGGMRPGSDIDVLVVVREHITAQQRRALVDGLLDLSVAVLRGEPGRPVELTIVVQGDVRPWRYPPRSEFQYGEWLREEFERGLTPTPAPDPDLAPLITMVLRGNAPLFGPPPAEVLDPVPHTDVVQALLAGVPQLLNELETDTRNVALTLARIWATVETGTIRSKDAAADWALARLPREHQPVLAHARAAYLGDDENWAPLRPQLRPYAAHVVSLIETRASADGGD